MKPSFEKVLVLGLGYVGLPTAAVLASRGVSVIGVDTNVQTVDLINQGKVHIVEPDLDIMVRSAVATGKLRAAVAVEPADAFIIAVPTPLTNEHKPDLGHVRAAAESLSPVLKKGDLIIIESTSPVGTTEAVSEWLAGQRADLAFPHQAGYEADVRIAHSPERVLPGRVLLELIRNDRVIGGLSARCAERAAQLYGLFIDGECMLTSARTAELVKLAENAYRDVSIAFANELSMVCGRLNIDVWEAVELANHHPRVGILSPGPGVGGHCIAVDPWFIADSAPAETTLIQAARQVNDAKPDHIVEAIKKAAEAVSISRIACLGLSYKADIDDLRESPAVKIVKSLALGKVGEVVVVEPHIRVLPEELQDLSSLKLVEIDAALDQSDIVVLLVDHQLFKAVDRARLQGKVVIDTRGIWR
ncbi:MAG TPA: UDP-N-acetyl-D-mannosamine dehydrogenase [Rhodospirillales bacterium]|nr:UDP-N-acetyl-D-mannosamine dehydrogenase [Rhodospirillales bacterium]